MAGGFDQLFDGAFPVGKEPTRLFRQVRDGAIMAIDHAESQLAAAITSYGPEHAVGYHDTAYYLPVIRCYSGEEVRKLGDLPPILARVRAQVKPELTFANARLAGEATWYASEIIEALRYVGEPAAAPPEEQMPQTGFIGDRVVRRFGVKMVDWTIPGEAIIFGRAGDPAKLAEMVRELMSMGFMLFLCDDVIDQLLAQNVKLGVDYMAYPLGRFTQIVHAANYALRAGMMFGSVKPGHREEQREYQRRSIRAFVLYLGEHDPVRTAAAFGAIFNGFPVLTDQPLAEDEQIREWFFSVEDYEQMLPRALGARGIKAAKTRLNLPVNFGPAFEGERIRKDATYVEMGGGYTTAFELVRSLAENQIEDGKVEVAGPEIDAFAAGSRLPFATMVDVYGRKMEEDYEGVLERRIHDFINYGEGLWHVSQRDLVWLRIGKDAVARGVKFRHLGEILVAKMKEEFPAIVDRVQVTIYTTEPDVVRLIGAARDKYRQRDERLRGLTDESVTTFYSCTLCQSFAPNHVCIITPERPGLCGAVSWLDAKASHEINPLGPNQALPKEGILDEFRGMWQSINDYVYRQSNQKLDKVNIYSILDSPMTSCGCFECILAVLPECNGIMVTTREYGGMTPCGMTFSTLAGMVGGGAQTPGFMGVGRRYITSRKFVRADGGLARLVWMPKELKESLREDIDAAARAEGLGNDYTAKIADETVGATIEEILPFLMAKGHPALALDPLL